MTQVTCRQLSSLHVLICVHLCILKFMNAYFNVINTTLNEFMTLQYKSYTDRILLYKNLNTKYDICTYVNICIMKI